MSGRADRRGAGRPARWASLASLLLLAACTQPTASSPPPVTPQEMPPSHGSVEPPAPAELAPGPSRGRRRMNLDQLDASLRRATGLGWEEQGVNQLERFGPSLGKPDYLLRTREVLDPSPIFQKFLDDAARSVCNRLAETDPARPAAERALFIAVPPQRSDGSGVGAQAVDANLMALLRRYHGRVVGPAAPELDGWRFLYRSALTVSGDTRKAWLTVCVGLVTHPDFYSY